MENDFKHQNVREAGEANNLLMQNLTELKRLYDNIALDRQRLSTEVVNLNNDTFVQVANWRDKWKETDERANGLSATLDERDIEIRKLKSEIVDRADFKGRMQEIKGAVGADGEIALEDKCRSCNYHKEIERLREGLKLQTDKAECAEKELGVARFELKKIKKEPRPITPEDVNREADRNYDLGRKHGHGERDVVIEDLQARLDKACLANERMREERDNCRHNMAHIREEKDSLVDSLARTEEAHKARITEILKVSKEQDDSLRAAIARLQSQHDMFRDEFIRIRNLAEDNSEIRGLCDRAVKGVERTVPLVKDCEHLTNENKGLKVEVDQLRVQLAGCSCAAKGYDLVCPSVKRMVGKRLCKHGDRPMCGEESVRNDYELVKLQLRVCGEAARGDLQLTAGGQENKGCMPVAGERAWSRELQNVIDLRVERDRLIGGLKRSGTLISAGTADKKTGVVTAASSGNTFVGSKEQLEKVCEECARNQCVGLSDEKGMVKAREGND